MPSVIDDDDDNVIISSVQCVLIICGCVRCRMKFVALLLLTVLSCVLPSGNHYNVVSVISVASLWSPYVIGQTIMVSSCDFFLLLFFLA